MRSALVVFLCTGCSFAQHKPAADPIMLATAIVDRQTGETLRRVPIRGYVRNANPKGPGVYEVGPELVDVRRGTRMRLGNKHVLLTDLDGKELWQRELSTRLAPRGDRRIVGDRILLARKSGGWVALERATGKTAWERTELPTAHCVIHEGLLVTAGPVTEEKKTVHVLDARSLRNGAKAFRVELSDPVHHLAVGSRGVAVSGKSWLRVFDRFGPELFAQKRGCDAIVAAPDGWVVRRGNEIASLDHKGKARWEAEDATDGFWRTKRMYVTARSDVFVTDHQPMSDTGAKCRLLAAKDGAVRWNAEIHGLGVSHSKYWHDIHAMVHGDRVTIRSQASGGAFFEVLELKTGKRVLRAKPK